MSIEPFLFFNETSISGPAVGACFANTYTGNGALTRTLPMRFDPSLFIVYGNNQTAVGNEAMLVWDNKRNGNVFQCHINTEPNIKSLEMTNNLYVSSNSSSSITLTADDSTSLKIFNDSTTYNYLAFKKGNSYFDVVTYTGDGSIKQAIPHELNQNPCMMWVTNRNSHQNVVIYLNNSSLTPYSANSFTHIFGTGSLMPFRANSNVWGNSNANSTHFCVGGDSGDPNLDTNLNLANNNYVAYLWAEHNLGQGSNLKSGWYTGVTSGATGRVDITGVGFEPKVLYISRYSTGSLLPAFHSNFTDPSSNVVRRFRGFEENNATTQNYGNTNISANITFHSDGFNIAGSRNAINSNGQKYFFLAMDY